MARNRDLHDLNFEDRNLDLREPDFDPRKMPTRAFSRIRNLAYMAKFRKSKNRLYDDFSRRNVSYTDTFRGFSEFESPEFGSRNRVKCALHGHISDLVRKSEIFTFANFRDARVIRNVPYTDTFRLQNLKLQILTSEFLKYRRN